MVKSKDIVASYDANLHQMNSRRLSVHIQARVWITEFNQNESLREELEAVYIVSNFLEEELNSS